jgi:hypothetical protein
MADVYASLGMSLDGYIAGPNARPGNPLGDGGPRIHQWMFGVCDSLEQAGHVRRERDTDDRRAYAVTITDSGRWLLARAEGAVPGFLDGTFGDLTAAEREQLSVLLGKLL